MSDNRAERQRPTDEELDRALHDARATSPSGPTVDSAAMQLAHAVAAEHSVPVGRRRGRGRIALSSGIALVLLGGGAAAASPVLMHWPPWEPDVMIEREFEVAGTSGNSCSFVVRVNPDDQTAGADQEERLEDARDFLASNDWSGLEQTTIEDLPPEDLEGPRNQGVSDQQILAMHLSSQISRDFDRAGFLGSGVSLEQAVRCDSEASE